MGAFFGQAEGGLDHKPIARFINEQEGVRVHLQGTADEVESQSEQFIQIERGGQSPAQRPKGPKLLDLLLECAVFGLQFSAAIEQPLDLFQGADFPSLGLYPEFQFLKSSLECCVVGLYGVT